MKKALIAFAGLLVASVALAQLVKYKDWAKSPEAYFLTPAERDEWSRIKTDDEAEKFIALYWAKRDPTLATPQNEFRDLVMRRIAAADEQFKMRRQKGSESARGRLFITLGNPSRVTQSRTPAQGSTPGTPDAGITSRPEGGLGTLEENTALTQTWIYEKDKFDPSWSIGELRARIAVDPQRGLDELTTNSAVDRAIAKAVEKSIVNPGGQVGAAAPPPAAVKPAVPSAATGATAPPPAPPTAALPAATRSSLEALLKENKDGSSSPFWGGTFRSIAGEPFYAFSFDLSADKAPSAPLKFGGVVVKDSGEPVASYWEDAVFSEMKTGNRADKVFEHSVVLPAGTYRGAFGLFPADGGSSLVSASASFKLEPTAKEFAVSPLILANTLTPLTKRPGPTDPFIFGMEKPIRVEPKANRLFAKEDSLWYFYTVSNPSVPEAPPAAAAPPTPAPGASVSAPAAPTPEAPKPRIMARIGVLRDGQPAFQPMTALAELQQLGPGYYASGSEIPLQSFEPGYYTFAINLRDLNTPRDSAANTKGIDRKEAFVVLKPDGSMPEKAAPKPSPAPTGKSKVPAKKG